MATAYIVWERRAQQVVGSGGKDNVFAQSADATTHINRLKQQDGRITPPGPAKTYDVLTVTI